jgi:membrane protease YdiL (CAAX protease family)
MTSPRDSEQAGTGSVGSAWVVDSANPPAERASARPENRSGGGREGSRSLWQVPWGAGEAVLVLFGGLIAGGLFAPLLVLPFDSDLESKPALLAAQFLFALTMVVFSLLVAMRWKPTGLRDALGLLGFRRAGPRQFGLALLVLLAYYAVALLFAALVLMPEQEDIARQLGLRDGNTAVAVTAVLMIVVAAPVAEEVFFRGMLFAGLRTKFSLWPAAILSGIAFGIPHVTSGPTAAIPLSIFGVALAWIYERTRSIWPCILVHVVNNGIAIMAA